MMFYAMKKSAVLAALLLASTASLQLANAQHHLRGMDSDEAVIDDTQGGRKLNTNAMHAMSMQQSHNHHSPPHHGQHNERQPRGQNQEEHHHPQNNNHHHGQEQHPAAKVKGQGEHYHQMPMMKAKKANHNPTPNNNNDHHHHHNNAAQQTTSHQHNNNGDDNHHHHHTSSASAKTKAQAVTTIPPSQHHDFSSRIVGGNNAGPGEFKFIASWDGSCGGSLIAPNMVLTAAHCAGIDGPLRIGSHLMSSGGVTRTVASQCSHPQYNDATTDNDYLILKLSQAVDTSKYPVVKLNNDASQPQDDEMLTVIGFGATSEGGSGSSRLQKVQVPANPHSVCAAQYQGVQRDIHLCAGFTSGGKDSCQGDSGGPIFEMQGTTAVQVGVVSFGDGCARPNKSGVYARVSGAYDWIQSTMKALDNDDTSNCLVSSGGGGGGGGGDGASPAASPVGFPTSSGDGSPSGSDGGESPSSSWWNGDSPSAGGGGDMFGGSPSSGNGKSPTGTFDGGSPDSWPTTWNGGDGGDWAPDSWPSWDGDDESSGESPASSSSSWWWNRALRGSSEEMVVNEADTTNDAERPNGAE